MSNNNIPEIKYYHMKEIFLQKSIFQDHLNNYFFQNYFLNFLLK